MWNSEVKVFELYRGKKKDKSNDIPSFNDSKSEYKNKLKKFFKDTDIYYPNDKTDAKALVFERLIKLYEEYAILKNKSESIHKGEDLMMYVSTFSKLLNFSDVVLSGNEKKTMRVLKSLQHEIDALIQRILNFEEYEESDEEEDVLVNDETLTRMIASQNQKNREIQEAYKDIDDIRKEIGQEMQKKYNLRKQSNIYEEKFTQITDIIKELSIQNLKFTSQLQEFNDKLQDEINNLRQDTSDIDEKIVMLYSDVKFLYEYIGRIDS